MGIPDNNSQLATLEISHSTRLLTLHAPEKHRATNVIQQTGTFCDSQLLGALGAYVSPDDLVLDVGADIGNDSLYFSAVCAARVIAYEPLATTADLLQRNIELNFLDDKVGIRRVRLASARPRPKTQAPISEDRKAEAPAPGPLQTSVTTLDMERIRNHVNLINVHIRGVGVDVLRGAVGLIMRDRPVIACKAEDRTSVEALTEFAVDIGYTFAGNYSPATTYILVPYRSDLERVRHQGRMADLAVQTNILARDLQHQLSLVSRRLTEVEKAIASHDGNLQDPHRDLPIAQRVSGMDGRLNQIQNTTTSTGLGSEHDSARENQHK